jgi:YebC/PmpR family DNA-binding regulatory protein
MSGHSKWSNIKHKKAKVDAQRGSVFTKISREISVAAKQGGGNPESNFRLKIAVQKAKEANIPNDNIQRAIIKGIGDNENANYEEIVYEGYGPGGSAFLLEILTDNRNRTAGDIRHLFSKNSGNLGETGCVSWMFDKKAYWVVEDNKVDEDTLIEHLINAGAEDVQFDGTSVEIFSAVDTYNQIATLLEELKLDPAVSEISMIPRTVVLLEEEDLALAMKLIDLLDAHDDVQNVFTNID